MYPLATAILKACDAAELDWCLRINRWARHAGVRRLFTVVSRLGDGIFWYALILLLPVIYGRAAIVPALTMAITGAVGALSYQWLKRNLVRERPYISHAGVHCVARPLDRYSFPSGHTLHAVSFAVVATHFFPELALLLVPFAALVALSRVVLGLHYPSDVAAGGTLGLLLALASLVIVG
ncbi:MAG TPA: phosphatase PAP2 family protein [Steroidobacteraceae bacterium]|nr:phosphatase PAP2 family protein [Steroidobacteraceae bacterium]